MNIYKLTSIEQPTSPDRYESLIVVAESQEKAKLIHPLTYVTLLSDGWFQVYSDGEKVRQDCWASHPDLVEVELIGFAGHKYDKPQIICTNYVGY